jgi:hypothetical protein
MPDPTLTTIFTQFGMAGLIAWMWLTERRAAAGREKQLTDAHERLMEDRRHVDALLEVVNANTRALSALETGQRELAGLLRHLTARQSPHPGLKYAPDTPQAVAPASSRCRG